jgi:hypothetical protein
MFTLTRVGVLDEASVRGRRWADGAVGDADDHAEWYAGAAPQHMKNG